MQPSNPLPRRLAWLALLVALAGAVGCSSPRLAYERLDWLAEWRLGQYVELDAAQSRQFETTFDELWNWHRRHELPRYGDDLRALADAAQAPMDAERLRALVLRADAHRWRTVARLMPDACALAASFSEAQVQALLARVDRDIARDQARYVEPSEAERREQAQRRLRRSIERWTGKLDEPQVARIKDWSLTRPLRDAEWIERRRAQRAQLAEVLAQRGAPDFCTRLQDLVLPASEAAATARFDTDQLRGWLDFAAGFTATLSPRQRQHLRDQLQQLAEDLDALHASG